VYPPFASLAGILGGALAGINHGPFIEKLTRAGPAEILGVPIRADVVGRVRKR
jgi:hypothetical protein